MERVCDGGYEEDGNIEGGCSRQDKVESELFWEIVLPVQAWKKYVKRK